MGTGAKVLAVIVILGVLWSFSATVFTVFTMARMGVYEDMLAAPGSAAAYFVPMALGVFFNLCAFVLAILVLASRRSPGAANAFN